MGRCSYSAQGAEDYYDANVDRYYEERDKEFVELIVSMAEEYLSVVKFGEEPSVVDFADQMDKEFDFKSEEEWLADEYEGELGACADRAYDEERDRRLGV